MGFDGTKPVLLVLGGSLGAQQLNDVVNKCDGLKNQFDIFVVCGKGKDAKGLKSAPYVDNIADLYASASVAITRCGSTTLAELTKAGVPFVGVPLVQNSRGEQVKNIEHFAKQGCGVMLDSPTPSQLENAVIALYNNRHHYQSKQAKLVVDGCQKVADIIQTYPKSQRKNVTKKGSKPAH